ncbi:MAG: hypothetical protein A2655_00450 [Candidatus Yanofskybacteria bacterium RIFCSPHIGHO2_01_FULL_43_42]|uniref:4-fold beta flower domain-containing protein n=1 Tax=Candidatus Yanofskybacteria bacterium RIFCSPLOWO2_01_FULL_43_22 TaxID=1802695 RepID=A0A1F8GFT7_9BACT|nr:MAG: hypothetical protein A2655_00450 [Candidatus Yanofskybacteria bacterium RIFCSPHIGHO2_01_FULL_43_42]OGN13728.1 MAG: hypothetical protein A3D48_00205 [Candidatus Yanofskybacteria bacterium RIFCSPHIGHO2_02_FULL_43_17]OGN24245.1 MAG: hypothetical protein A3A13_03645 [Candidatus Yanofskybacteria bacterium RIFCSPLOWO2_01_FULL_43_22]
MQRDIIYDIDGDPVLRLLNNGRFVTFDGESIGFLVGDNVYDYNGYHRGWFVGGTLRDHFGDCVGFGINVGNIAHPLFPLRKLPPLPSLVELEPLRPFTSLPPLKPLFSMSWSESNPISLFKE